MLSLEHRTLRTSCSPPADSDAAHLDWTVALAGGEGVRLQDYVTRRFGRRIPKQYCCLLGARSMLEHTLDRMIELTPASRTLTVIGTHHRELAAPQLAGRSDHVFCQPASRDTGLALYVALAMIRRWSPRAVVTVTPTDHYVAPSASYVAQVRAARDLAAQVRDRVILLGARPSEPDPDLGYVQPGAPLSVAPHAREVTAFIEKPAVARARELWAAGALWNTMVAVGTLDALWALGQATEPRLLDILDSLVPLIGTSDEDDAIDYIYRAYLPVSFSRDMLERAPHLLVSIALDGVEWSDWGRPERIETVLALRRSRALVQERTLAP